MATDQEIARAKQLDAAKVGHVAFPHLSAQTVLIDLASTDQREPITPDTVVPPQSPAGPHPANLRHCQRIRVEHTSGPGRADASGRRDGSGVPRVEDRTV